MATVTIVVLILFVLLMIKPIMIFVMAFIRDVIHPILHGVLRSLSLWMIFATKKIVAMHVVLFQNLIKSNEDIYPSLQDKERSGS